MDHIIGNMIDNVVTSFRARRKTKFKTLIKFKSKDGM